MVRGDLAPGANSTKPAGLRKLIEASREFRFSELASEKQQNELDTLLGQQFRLVDEVLGAIEQVAEAAS